MQPIIDVFNVTPPSIVTGQSVNITWQVEQAQDVELLVDGVPRPLDNLRGSFGRSADHFDAIPVVGAQSVLG